MTFDNESARIECAGAFFICEALSVLRNLPQNSEAGFRCDVGYIRTIHRNVRKPGCVIRHGVISGKY